MHVALVRDPADIDRVRQYLVDVTPAQKAPAGRSACPIGADGKPEVFAVDDLLEPDHAPDFEIAPKEIAHELSMMFDNMQSAVLNPVAERNHPAHPHALLLGRGRRRRPVASRRLCSPCRHASLPPPPASPAIRRRPRRGRYFETLPHVLPPGRQRMVPLCRAGRTAYRGRDHRRDFQPQHDRPRRDWDKPARAATVFIHYGAPPALVGCLDQWRSTRNCMPMARRHRHRLPLGRGGGPADPHRRNQYRCSMRST